MKKIYTLAIMALAGVAQVNAQALELKNNYVMKTCAVLPEGTEPIITQQEVDGVVKDVVKCPLESKINGVADKIANAFIDDEYNSFPLSGGTAGGTNYHVLEQDYTDASTGISFKAGTYSCLNSNTAINFYDNYNPQGVSNIKQVIFYLASSGQLQFYARQYKGTDTGLDYCHFEGDPTNRKLKSYKAPGFSTPRTDGAQWYELHFNKPLKLVVDLTNAQGTAAEMTSANLEPNKSADDTEEVRALLQYYEKAFDADNNMIQGDKLVPWTAEGKFAFQFKKKAYVMGIAVICGDENAKTRTIDLSEDNPQWSAPAATGIDNIMSGNAGAEKIVEAVYNVGGMRMSALGKGVNIVRYSDGTSVKVIK
ncbi:MAG: hypothetical protein KHX42_12305 [Prevotella sp.]|nr:hypothetical protein [Prevotella sp.]